MTNHRNSFSRKPAVAISARRQQTGVTLAVVLIMLTIILVIAITAINLSSVNLKIVGNVQQRMIAESVAQTAIETTLNSSTYFYNPVSTVPLTPPSSLTVTVGTRVCLGASPAKGYSAAQALVPEDTHWDIPVTVVDNLTGASVTMHQGVGIKMSAGNCPP